MHAGAQDLVRFRDVRIGKLREGEAGLHALFQVHQSEDKRPGEAPLAHHAIEQMRLADRELFLDIVEDDCGLAIVRHDEQVTIGLLFAAEAGHLSYRNLGASELGVLIGREVRLLGLQQMLQLVKAVWLIRHRYRLIVPDTCGPDSGFRADRTRPWCASASSAALPSET